ncbi:MAG: hypothetical protein ACYC28_02555 [Longimicrobiales bacterium]
MDKEGVEMWVPMNEDARPAVDLALERNPAIGDTPLFPAPKSDLDEQLKSWSRWHAQDLHERANRAAGYRYSCPACGAALGNEQWECPSEKCAYVDRKPRDPAKRLLGFHAYRRKWATERHLPVKDVAEAGGWLDTRSLELPAGGRGDDARCGLRAPEAAGSHSRNHSTPRQIASGPATASDCRAVISSSRDGRI